MAGIAGLEPTIPESKSSVLPLHYIPSQIQAILWKWFYGVGKGIRTLGIRNHNPALYQLSYTHHIALF